MTLIPKGFCSRARIVREGKLKTFVKAETVSETGVRSSVYISNGYLNYSLFLVLTYWTLGMALIDDYGDSQKEETISQFK